MVSFWFPSNPMLLDGVALALILHNILQTVINHPEHLLFWFFVYLLYRPVAASACFNFGHWLICGTYGGWIKLLSVMPGTTFSVISFGPVNYWKTVKWTVNDELERNWGKKVHLLMKSPSPHFPGEPGLFSSTVDVLAKIRTERLSNTSVQQQHTWLFGFRVVISSRLVRIPRTIVK